MVVGGVVVAKDSAETLVDSSNVLKHLVADVTTYRVTCAPLLFVHRVDDGLKGVTLVRDAFEEEHPGLAEVIRRKADRLAVESALLVRGYLSNGVLVHVRLVVVLGARTGAQSTQGTPRSRRSN